MRYPVSQSAECIPAVLRPLLSEPGSWHINANKKTYRLRLNNGAEFTWTQQQLQTLDARIIPTLEEAFRVYSHAQIAQGLLRQNVRCWYEAMVLDFADVVQKRYFVQHIRAVGRDRDNVKLELRAFNTKEDPADAYVSQRQRHDVMVYSVRSEYVQTTTAQLEAWWPGSLEKLTLCEDFNLSPREQAVQLFNTSAPTTNAVLPDGNLLLSELMF